MSGKFILDGKTPIPTPDLHAWAQWMATADRTVALDEIDGVKISTVFLGLEYFGGSLFETMVFGGPAANNQHQERYRTWEQAEQGHKQVCNIVRAALAQEMTEWPSELPITEEEAK